MIQALSTAACRATCTAPKVHLDPAEYVPRSPDSLMMGQVRAGLVIRLQDSRSACLCVARHGQPNRRSAGKVGRLIRWLRWRSDDGDGIRCMFSANAWLVQANQRGQISAAA